MHIADEKHVIAADTSHRRLCFGARPHPGATEEDLRSHIRLDLDAVVAEVSAQTFHMVNRFDHLPHDYVLEFAK